MSSFGNEAYAKEELVACISEALMGQRMGFYADHIDNHAAYIDSWIKVLKGDTRFLFTAAAHAQRAVEAADGIQRHPQSPHIAAPVLVPRHGEAAVREAEPPLGDLAEGKPMDRLVCGDVGYGKTEVAMRAAFKAVCAGKQVAVLVPTTVLAQQHFNTFNERGFSLGFLQ